jgi:hypothetical protein
MDGKVAFRCSVRLHSRLLRPFSDSFKAKFSIAQAQTAQDRLRVVISQ